MLEHFLPQFCVHLMARSDGRVVGKDREGWVRSC